MDLEQISETGKTFKIIWAFHHFVEKGMNVDFFDKEDFEKFLDNEEKIINLTITEGDGKLFLIKRVPHEKTIKILSRLREIYEHRFKEKEEDLIIKQRLYLLEKLKFFEMPLLNGSTLTQTAKQKLISKIIKCDPRAVKGYMNGEPSYYPTDNEKKVIDNQYKTITGKEK